MVAAAVIGSAVVGAGTSAVMSSKAAKAQKKAAKTAADAQIVAADKALLAQKEGTAEARKAAEEAAAKAQAAQDAAYKETQDIYNQMSDEAKAEYERTYGDVEQVYKQAYDRAVGAYGEAYNTQMGLQQPYRHAGLTAQQQIMQLMGLGGDKNAADFGAYAKPFGTEQFEQDPGYAFRQEEGMRALERSAAARGGLLSGNMLKGVQRFSQGLASQEYENAFNRYQTERAARLSTLEKLNTAGQNASNVMTGAASEYGARRGAAAQAYGVQQAGNRQGYGNAMAGNTYNTAQLLAGNRQRYADTTAQNAYNVANAVASGALNYGNAAANSAYYAGNAAAQGATNAGAARASGYVGAANAINQGIGSIANYMVQAPLYNAMANYYNTPATGGAGTYSPSSNYSNNYLNRSVA